MCVSQIDLICAMFNLIVSKNNLLKKETCKSIDLIGVKIDSICVMIHSMYFSNRVDLLTLTIAAYTPLDYPH